MTDQEATTPTTPHAPPLRTASPLRIGLGLAAVGRPGYITLGRRSDLPEVRSTEALMERAFELMDEAYAHGVRYFDAARSYGLAETYLAQWLYARPDIKDVVIGSKWGYTYTSDWRTDADVHEVKDHSFAAYRRQVTETRALLGDWLNLYQIHSVTTDSPALGDTALHEQLVQLVAAGVTVELSTSGPHQAETIRKALTVTVGGRRLFGCVQTTYNLLEPSAGSAVAEAHVAGCAVIVKEALANGRLTGPISWFRIWTRYARSPGRQAPRATPSPSPQSLRSPGPTSCSPEPPLSISSPATSPPPACASPPHSWSSSPSWQSPPMRTGRDGHSCPGHRSSPRPTRTG
jgi:aryl-alcohol dehydrogenase-like predicted oxidoreductase